MSRHLKSNLKPFSHRFTKTSSPTVFSNTSHSPSKTFEETDGPEDYPALRASRFALKFVLTAPLTLFHVLSYKAYTSW